VIDDLPEDLAALVSAERATRPSPEIYASVRAKLAASAVVVTAATVSKTSAAAAGSPVAAGTGLATKLVVVLALAVGGTTAVVALTRPSSPTSPSTTVPRTSTPRAPSVSTTNAATPIDVPEPPSAAAPPAAVPPSVRSASPTSPAPPPFAPSGSREHVRSVERTHLPPAPTPAEPPPAPAPEEAETVARAWRTLATDPAAALAEIQPITGGTLVEEREAIRCVALARLHRAEAADAITQFLSAHPRSVHRALVERAQKGLP